MPMLFAVPTIVLHIYGRKSLAREGTASALHTATYLLFPDGWHVRQFDLGNLIYMLQADRPDRLTSR